MTPSALTQRFWLFCHLVILTSSFLLSSLWAQAPRPCPPGGERSDYGTICSSTSAIVNGGLAAAQGITTSPTSTAFGGLGTVSSILSNAELMALQGEADTITIGVKRFLETIIRYPSTGDYYSRRPNPYLEDPDPGGSSPQWTAWYGDSTGTAGHKQKLVQARLNYWAIYVSSQGDAAVEQRRQALIGMRDATYYIAGGHLIFGQQFLLEALNARYTREDLLLADRIIREEQCLLGGARVGAICDYTDPNANASAQFDAVLTDFTSIYNLSLRDGTTLGSRLQLRELDLFRMAIERSGQVSTEITRNFYALGQDGRSIDEYREVLAARYIQMAATLPRTISEVTDQVISLVNQISTLRQGTLNALLGFNPLGYDERYTPLLPYAGPDGAYGLVEDALFRPTVGAVALEQAAKDLELQFVRTIEAQQQERENLTSHYFEQLATLCGISTAQAEELTAGQIANVCDNPRSVLKEKFNLLQASNAQVQAAEARVRAIPSRISIEEATETVIESAHWQAAGLLALIDLLEAITRSIENSRGCACSIFGIPTPFSFTQGLIFGGILGGLAGSREFVVATRDVTILQARSRQRISELLLDLGVEVRNLDVAIQSANASANVYNNTLLQIQNLIAGRDRVFRELAEDPTLEITRVLQTQATLDALAKFNDAIRRMYMLAKVVEYETLRPLGGDLDIRGLFKIRRAIDLADYLSRLDLYHRTYRFSSQRNQYTYRNMTITRDFLGFTRETLQCQPDGTNCQGSFFSDGPNPVDCMGENADACRRRIFREYARRQTTVAENGRQTLTIDFSTPIDGRYPDSPDPIFDPTLWNNKLAGIREPIETNQGVNISYRTTQKTSLGSISVRLTQLGHLWYRTESCQIVEYRPRDPRAFLPYRISDGPVPVNPDVTTATIAACSDAFGCRMPQPVASFSALSVYSSAWRLEIEAGPGSPNPNLDLSQLYEILLHFDTTGFSLRPEVGRCP